MWLLVLSLAPFASAQEQIPESFQGRYAEQEFVDALTSGPVQGRVTAGLMILPDRLEQDQVMDTAEYRVVSADRVGDRLELKLSSYDAELPEPVVLLAGPRATVAFEGKTWVRTADALPMIPENVSLQQMATLSLLSHGYHEDGQDWFLYPSLDRRAGAVTRDGRSLVGGFGFIDEVLLEGEVYGFNVVDGDIHFREPAPQDSPDLDPLPGGRTRILLRASSPPFLVVADKLNLRRRPAPSAERVGLATGGTWVRLWALQSEWALIQDGDQLGWASTAFLRERHGVLPEAGGALVLGELAGRGRARAPVVVHSGERGRCVVDGVESAIVAGVTRASIRLVNLDGDSVDDLVCLFEGAGRVVACPMLRSAEAAVASPCGELPAWPDAVSAEGEVGARTLILGETRYGRTPSGWLSGVFAAPAAAEPAPEAAEPVPAPGGPEAAPSVAGCLCATSPPVGGALLGLLGLLGVRARGSARSTSPAARLGAGRRERAGQPDASRR